MRDLLSRGVLPDGRLRPIDTACSTEFGVLPHGWTHGSLLDVAETNRQPILTGPFGADLGNDDFVPEGIPLLRIGNVRSGSLDLGDLLYVTQEKAIQLARYAIKAGDLLFTRQGTTGRSAIATSSVEGALINYHIIRVALDHEKCSPLFVEAALGSETVAKQVRREKGRGTRDGINTAQLKALRVPLAPLAEQRAIARLLIAWDDQNSQLWEHEAKLRRLKAALMQDLLTGRVRVPLGGARKEGHA